MIGLHVHGGNSFEVLLQIMVPISPRILVLIDLKFDAPALLAGLVEIRPLIFLGWRENLIQRWSLSRVEVVRLFWFWSFHRSLFFFFLLFGLFGASLLKLAFVFLGAWYLKFFGFRICDHFYYFVISDGPQQSGAG